MWDTRFINHPRTQRRNQPRTYTKNMQRATDLFWIRKMEVNREYIGKPMIIFRYSLQYTPDGPIGYNGKLSFAAKTSRVPFARLESKP
jgi:hypothetical protein